MCACVCGVDGVNGLSRSRVGFPGRGIPAAARGCAEDAGGGEAMPPPGAVTTSQARPGGREGAGGAGAGERARGGEDGASGEVGAAAEQPACPAGSGAGWRGCFRYPENRSPQHCRHRVRSLRASRWASLQFQQPQREPGAAGGSDRHLGWGIRDPTNPQAQPAACPGAGAQRLRSQPVSQGGGRRPRASWGKAGLKMELSRPEAATAGFSSGWVTVLLCRGAVRSLFSGAEGPPRGRPEQPGEGSLAELPALGRRGP